MTEQSMMANPVASMTARRRWAALGAVVLVPLAFAGLFVAAVGSGDGTLSGIPAAIVNDDSLVTTTADDGTTTNVFAGRQLVTELTADDRTGFDWTISNAEDAAAALKAGDVYAVLTIPSNFSESIMSVQTDSPEQAHISIRTDDAHSYLTTTLASAVADGTANAFGAQVTEQVLGGIYSSFGDIGNAFTQAADGAGKLADGAHSFTSGLDSYTGGVSSLANGLGQLDSGAAKLSQLSSGVDDYTDGVDQLSATLASINGDLQSNGAISAYDKAVLQGVVDGLGQASAGGKTLDSSTQSAVSGIQSGISQSAHGAHQLAANGPALVNGAKDITSGARDLSKGLADGAKQLPSADDATSDAAAKVAADPVAVTVKTDNPVTEIGQIIATFLVPLGLWVGALAVFLVLRPISRRALASTAANSRLVASALIRASAVTLAQAALLVLLLHVSLGVAWSLLPLTVLFSVIMALAFTAFHYLLTVWVGRAGLVVSLFVLAIQITATGGLYPIELLAAPFQAISPFLPLTYGVSGMQAIIAGGSMAGLVTASVALVLFGAASVALALVSIRRTRSAAAIGLLPRVA